jgi:hypothetical protein
MTAFHSEQDAVGTTQRSCLNAHPLAGTQKLPGLGAEPCLRDPLERFHLMVRHLDRAPAVADNANDAGRDADSTGQFRVEVAEDIARKERAINFLEPIRPAAKFYIRRKEYTMVAQPQLSRCEVLASRPHLHRKPPHPIK